MHTQKVLENEATIPRNSKTAIAANARPQAYRNQRNEKRHSYGQDIFWLGLSPLEGLFGLLWTRYFPDVVSRRLLNRVSDFFASEEGFVCILGSTHRQGNALLLWMAGTLTIDFISGLGF